MGLVQLRKCRSSVGTNVLGAECLVRVGDVLLNGRMHSDLSNFMGFVDNNKYI